MTKSENQKEYYNIDFKRIKELISKFEQIKQSGEIKKYNEESTKKDFILPLFEALGWNVYNKENRNDSVSAEEKISKKRVDYGFRINGIPKFFLEAKPLKEQDIQNNSKYVTQAIDYAWMKSCSWAILTNFEILAVYNADWKSSNLYGNLFFVLHPNDFLTNSNLKMLSKDAFERDEIDKKALEYGKKQLKNTIDKQLLADMISFREILSKNIVKNNQDKKLSQDDVDESVQRILDRLIFIRNAEDRGLEENKLLSNVRQWSAKGKGELIKEISKVYSYYDEQYNSKLFDHHLCDDLYIDNEALQEVIEGLNHSKDNSYRYDFSIIESDVLGNIYEQYLGNILKKTSKRAKLEESKTHRKEQGIYYTPSYIVDYIVKNTVGEYIKTHTPEEIKKVRILDPACGSGSFLIRAYKELENYWKQNSDFAQLTLDSEEFYSKKVEILKNNIFGVDLDPKAVEIAQLNLLLQISERKQRLPLLQNNIKVGNSLIDDPSISDRAFKWEEQFPEIMKEGGFDIVIGNPPYGKGTSNELEFMKLKGIKDTYTAFIIKGIQLLRVNGFLGFIVPVSWETGERYFEFRDLILEKMSFYKIINLPYDTFRDAYVDTCIAIFIKKQTSYFLGYEFPKKENAKRLFDVEGKLVRRNMKEILQDPLKKVILSTVMENISKTIEKVQSVSLGEITKSTIGVLTSKYTISDSSKDKYLKFFEGNVYRYKIVTTGFKFIDMGKHSVDYLDYYKGCRILVRRIINRQDRIMAMITNEDFVTKKDLYSFKVIDNKFFPEYILALLNSKLFSYLYVNSSSISLKDDFRQTTLAELRRLPIAVIEPEAQKEIANIVRNIIDLYAILPLDRIRKFTDKENFLIEKIRMLENNLDRTVYKIYGLNDSQIAEIEGRYSQI